MNSIFTLLNDNVTKYLDKTNVRKYYVRKVKKVCSIYLVILFAGFI